MCNQCTTPQLLKHASFIQQMSQRGLNKNLKTYKFQNHGKQDWVSEKNMCQQCQKVKSINFYVFLMQSTISTQCPTGRFSFQYQIKSDIGKNTG